MEGVSIENGVARWLAPEGAVNARAVVPGVLLRSDNLQGLTPQDVRRLIDKGGLEVVLDLRADVEVALEGPGPLTREPAVRIEHRSLYPQSGNTDLDEGTVRPWGDADPDHLPQETPLVRACMSYLARLVSSETYRAELEGHDPQRHVPVGGTMERVLEILDERAGGSAAWLTTHGLAGAHLERLRSRLWPD